MVDLYYVSTNELSVNEIVFYHNFSNPHCIVVYADHFRIKKIIKNNKIGIPDLGRTGVSDSELIPCFLFE